MGSEMGIRNRPTVGSRNRCEVRRVVGALPVRRMILPSPNITSDRTRRNAPVGTPLWLYEMPTVGSRNPFEVRRVVGAFPVRTLIVPTPILPSVLTRRHALL